MTDQNYNVQVPASIPVTCTDCHTYTNVPVLAPTANCQHCGSHFTLNWALPATLQPAPAAPTTDSANH